MSEKARDENGRYSSKLTEQAVLKAFDYETSPAEPMLTATEIAEALRSQFDVDVSAETVRRRLDTMEADGQVASKRFGARAKGWVALVAPAVSTDVAAESDARREGEFHGLDEV